MKNFTLFMAVILLSMFSSLTMQAQVSKTVDIATAGTLSTILTANELATVTDLTITGTIDARDFKTMRDAMPVLASIDLSTVNVAAYTGVDGTNNTSSTAYPANELPQFAFCNLSTWSFKTTLTSCKLPISVTSIGESAFRSCSGLTMVSIPDAVKTIKDFSFFCCGSLDFVKIPSSVYSIGFQTFSYCVGLASITIPSSVNSIDRFAFSGSNCLINVEVANLNYSSMDGILFNKAQTLLIQCPISKTGNYSIPSSVTLIGDYAFFSCSGLTSVAIPTSVTSIGDMAFGFCSSLTTVTIPASVSSISSYAFFYCSSLTTIYAKATTPVDLSSQTSVFQNVNITTCTLYIPIWSKSAYQAADQWKDFTHIIEMASSLNDKQANEPIIYSRNGALHIENIEVNSSVKVYDISGRIRYAAKILNSTFNVELNKGAMYIVKINDKSYKVML